MVKKGKATTTASIPLLPPDLSKTGCLATAAGQEGVEAPTLCVEEELEHCHQPGVRGECLWRTRCQAEERGVASG